MQSGESVFDCQKAIRLCQGRILRYGQEHEPVSYPVRQCESCKVLPGQANRSVLYVLVRPIGAKGHRNTGRIVVSSCKSAHSGHQRDMTTEKTMDTDVYNGIWLLISVSLDLYKFD